MQTSSWKTILIKVGHLVNICLPTCDFHSLKSRTRIFRDFYYGHGSIQKQEIRGDRVKKNLGKNSNVILEFILPREENTG